MEDRVIKLLYINSKVHALVNINHSPAGETGLGAITQPIAANSTFFLTVLPLENEKNFIYLPYTRRISLAGGGSIFSNDGLVELCVWPDNIVELTLNPEAVYRNEEKEMFPSVISPFDFYIGGERHTAFIYNESGSTFAVEHSATNRLAFLSPLPFYVASADINFLKLGDYPVLTAAGNTAEAKPFFYAAGIIPSFYTAVCTLCEASQVGSGSISVITQGDFRQVKTTYEKKDSRLAPVRTEAGWFTCAEREPQTPAELAASLIEAVKTGMADEAIRCLTPSLSDGLSFSDLKEFFGDFSFFTDSITPACAASSVALKYPSGLNIFTAREFCLETKQAHGALLIDNIREP